MDISITSVLKFLASKWLIILIALCIGAGGGFAYSNLFANNEHFTSERIIAVTFSLSGNDIIQTEGEYLEKQNVFESSYNYAISAKNIETMLVNIGYKDKNGFKINPSDIEIPLSEGYISLKKSAYTIKITAGAQTSEMAVNIVNEMTKIVSSSIKDFLKDNNCTLSLTEASIPNTKTQLDIVTPMLMFGLGLVLLVTVILIIYRILDKRIYSKSELNEMFTIETLGCVTKIQKGDNI